MKHDIDMVIENNNSIYELKGAFVKSTLHIFEDRFEHIFDEENHLTICTVGLDHIDLSGVRSIVKLHNEALSKNKQLSIIGAGNQELFDHLKPLGISKNRTKSKSETMRSGFVELSKWFKNYKRKTILPQVNALHTL